MSKREQPRARLGGVKLALPESDNSKVFEAMGAIPAGERKVVELVHAAEHQEPAPRQAVLAVAAETLANFPVGTLVEAPLYLLMEDPYNARDLYTSEDIDDMTRSLREKGQDVPIAAYCEDGKLWVFDGVKRLKGARNGGLAALRVEIKAKPESPLHVYLASRRMNLQRSAQSALDDAIRWQQLLTNQLVANQAELAKHVEKSEAYVSQVLGINRIPRSVLMHMKERPGATDQTTAYKISGIFTPDRRGERGDDEVIEIAKSIVDEIHEKKLSRSEVDRLIDKRLGPPRTRTRAEHAKLEFRGVTGLVKTFPSKGQLDLSIKGLPATDLTELEKIIREAVATHAHAKKQHH